MVFGPTDCAGVAVLSSGAWENRPPTRVMANAPLLELTDATVIKDGVPVLDGLTLTIRAGEHTAILGPNGAGKSTLMKLLTLQVYPFAGSNGTAPIRLFGRDRWDVFDLRSQLGIVSADLHDRFVHGNAAGA